MLKHLIVFALTFSSPWIGAADLGNLNNAQLQTLHQNEQALIVDIRTQQEWHNTGIIPDSHKLEFFDKKGNYNAQAWLEKLNKLKSSPQQPVILVCRSGNRSAMVGNFLAKQQGFDNIYHLSSGIQAWIKAGNKTEPDCPTQVACK